MAWSVFDSASRHSGCGSDRASGSALRPLQAVASEVETMWHRPHGREKKRPFDAMLLAAQR